MKILLIQVGICLGVFGVCLYSYLERQNELTKMKIYLPQVEQEIAAMREENQRLTYQIEQFENPAYLIDIAHRPEFSHLKHPLLKEILTVPQAYAVGDLSQ